MGANPEKFKPIDKQIKAAARRDYLLRRYATYKDLARAHQLSKRTLRQWVKHEGWDKDREKLDFRAKAGEHQAIISDEEVAGERYRAAFDRLSDCALKSLLRSLSSKRTMGPLGIERWTKALSRLQRAHKEALALDRKKQQRDAEYESIEGMSDEELEEQYRKAQEEIQKIEGASNPEGAQSAQSA